ncbi:MAG: hypothetical protein AMXMBFR45_03830 [Gammaproteobacteria bacterium]|nr:hypothetical protein [Gammaproteobacteria bacterium]MCE7897038.1 hypothetical protein [Gammaproteobacteria bacterium PRO8]MCQ3934022.1 hypothetical protein [Gammaproteobacteria bacterium]MDL1880765.1 hypothetical protein [Gammaproteobacteria bacterium PRO2]GIK36091.1 MAG: hypothetical protein BroJett010_26500 [Gammaproteobacteria bacterium]
MDDRQNPATGTGHRIFLGAFGLLLLGTGLYALLFSAAGPLLRFGAGIALVVLGANAVYAACTARQAWLSRIGPLP